MAFSVKKSSYKNLKRDELAGQAYFEVYGS